MKLLRIIQVSFKSKDKCPYERQIGGEMRQKRKEGGHVKTQAETGVMQPRANEGLKPPDA